MLTAIHWTEHRVPNEGARERTQGAEGVVIPIRGTTIWKKKTVPPELCGTTNQTKYMVGLMNLAAHVAEDGIVGH